MLLINGICYYKVTEAAELAGVNARTLRRWITNGNLAHFLFPYRRTKSGPMYYRLEPPKETDVLWDGEPVYQMPEETDEEGEEGRHGDEGEADETGE